MKQGSTAAARRMARAKAIEARGNNPLASRKALRSAGTGRRARMQYEGKRNPEGLQFAATTGRIAAGKKPSKGYKAPYSMLPGGAAKLRG